MTSITSAVIQSVNWLFICRAVPLLLLLPWPTDTLPYSLSLLSWMLSTKRRMARTEARLSQHTSAVSVVCWWSIWHLSTWRVNPAARRWQLTEPVVRRPTDTHTCMQSKYTPCLQRLHSCLYFAKCWLIQSVTNVMRLCRVTHNCSTVILINPESTSMSPIMLMWCWSCYNSSCRM